MHEILIKQFVQMDLRYAKKIFLFDTNENSLFSGFHFLDYLHSLICITNVCFFNLLKINLFFIGLPPWSSANDPLSIQNKLYHCQQLSNLFKTKRKKLVENLITFKSIAEKCLFQILL